MNSAQAGYRFGQFVLLPSEHALFRGPEAVRLTRLDFELLLALVERSGHLVRKDELLQRLWPDTAVEEGNLAKHVSLLRKALGDRDEGGSYIETVPRVGFRFITPVEPFNGANPTPASPPSRARDRRVLVVAIGLLLLVGAGSAALVLSKSAGRAAAPRWQALAILPFTTLDSAGADVDALGVGLADGITHGSAASVSCRCDRPARSASTCQAIAPRRLWSASR